MTGTPEEIYDREIAPVLLALAKKCEGHGFSLVAMVEFALARAAALSPYARARASKSEWPLWPRKLSAMPTP